MPDTGGYNSEVIPFRAGDGFGCNLVHVWGEREPTRGPVLLVHGAGVRANIFCAPTPQNLVGALLDAGYDVWLENWRASIDFAPNPWTLDQAAVFDHPVAMQEVVQRTGSEHIKAVVHCQGSTSFTMSLAAGLLPNVTTVVSNAVSMFPVIPAFSRGKLGVGLPAMRPFLRYLNPAWGLHASTWQAKLILGLVLLVHHECDNSVCKLVSFTYGSGFPALWEHANLDPGTHEWLKGEFAAVPLTFFSQMLECVRAGHLVPVPDDHLLPDDLVSGPPRSTARISFFAGERNRCFLPESQVLAHSFFDAFRPHYHTLHLLPQYSHLDVFMGKDAHKDVFPLMLAELGREGTPA